MTTERDPIGGPRHGHTLRHILFAIPATICLTVVSTGLILLVSSI
ncbi:hypothetical protein [Sphingomonas montanisoli]|nr:hypothetical protein [Sphingomonas montanisoli]